TIDHNTIIQDHASGLISMDLAPIPGFTLTNNLSRHSTNGIVGTGYAPGMDSINAYLPASRIVANVIADADSTKYPVGNSFPTFSAFRAQFVSYEGGNYRLVA